MNSNIIKAAYRGLKKQKQVALINLAGLGIGLALVMYLAVYLENELHTDKFHQNADGTYRIEAEVQSKVYPLTAGPMAQWMKDNFPEVQLSTRIFSPFYSTAYYARVNDCTYEIKQPVFVDPSFFQIFSFPVVSGNLAESFDNKYGVVLTEPMAKKLFGNENAVGKTFDYCGKNLLTVAAIVKELPANSSMQFELLLPFAGFNEYNSFDLSNWGRLTYQTIVLSASNPDLLSQGINQKMKEQFPDKEFKYSLIPFKAIHFSTSSTYDLIFRHGNKSQLYLFMLVAICVLLIAVINFVNLTISLSGPRFKENSIRKLEGASQWQLSLRFIAEAVLVSTLAAILAILLIELSFSLFNHLLDCPLGRQQIRQPWFYAGLLGLSILIGGIAGAYPAYKFSRVTAVGALQNKYSGKFNSGTWSNGLLVFQFTTSIALIISSLFLNRQMNFIQDQQLGFDKGQVLLVKLNDELIAQKDVIASQLERIPGVEYVSLCNFVPGQTYAQKILSLNVKGEEISHQVYHTKVSGDYIKTLGISMVDGRDFDSSRKADRGNYLVNETFVREYGITDPVEMPLDGAKIIGVVKDFNFCSLHEPVGPMLIRWVEGDPTTMMIRINASKLSSLSTLIGSLKKCISSLVPNTYFEIQFLDEFVQKQYIKDTRTTKLLGYFSLFAIFISCLGLFALAKLTIDKRTKEIGIRKVNGAKETEILTLLNKDFVKWVIVAFVIAAPIAWFAMYKWLENFAYKASLSWWIFAIAGMITLGIALLTVSFQSYKAAVKNPVEALRYE